MLPSHYTDASTRKANDAFDIDKLFSTYTTTQPAGPKQCDATHTPALSQLDLSPQRFPDLLSLFASSIIILSVRLLGVPENSV